MLIRGKGRLKIDCLWEGWPSLYVLLPPGFSAIQSLSPGILSEVDIKPWKNGKRLLSLAR